MPIQPFTVAVPQTAVDDLRGRLTRARWPDEVEGAGWNYGTNLGYLKGLVASWRDDFDGRAQETRLSRFAQSRADIDGCGVHFIRGRGPGPGRCRSSSPMADPARSPRCSRSSRRSPIRRAAATTPPTRPT